MRWHATERAVIAQLRPELRPFLGLARASHNFLEYCIQTVMTGRKAPPGHAAEVQVRILTRVSHDLRVVELASLRSYTLQALSVASTIYELSNAVAFIGGDLERARRWETHDMLGDSYPSRRQRKEAVRSSLLALWPDIPAVDAAVEEQERLYRALCIAKHGNPKAMRHFGVAVEGRRIQLRYGPFFADYIIRQARFALYHSARMLLGATIVFADRMIANEDPGTVRGYRRRQGRVTRRLRAVARSVPSSQ